jgi:hypothetical protein
MTRTNPIMLLAAVALSLGIVSPKLTPTDHQPSRSKSDILLAADEGAASTPAATGTQDSAKGPDSRNNNGQTTNTQAKSDKMTAEPSTPK